MPRTVYIVDDDADVRQSLELLLDASGYEAHCFASANAFLSDANLQKGCVVTDVRMPGMSGLDLQEKLNARGVCLPVIVLTGHSDVSLAVKALKNGAVDFIEKPYEPDVLIESIERAVRVGIEQRSEVAGREEARSLLAELTTREKELFALLVNGYANKVAAHTLGISPRTVEIHRSNIMRKLNAKKLSDLVLINHTALLDEHRLTNP